MNVALTSLQPLNPYLWDAPQRTIVAPGSRVGAVANVLHHIAGLQLQFDLIVKEFEGPYHHPVYDAFHTHPVHTCALNKRQFDVLRYGMVLDEVERLVLLPAPRSCADSGTKVAREFAAIFNDTLDGSEVAQHTLMPEYCFLVYQLPTAEAIEQNDGKATPEPLFRLVFRNEAYHQTAIAEMCTHFPLFRLRAVLVSEQHYSTLKQIYEYRQFHPGTFTTAAGKVLPNPKIEELLRLGELAPLCDAWLKVLDGIAPRWVREQGTGPDVVGLFLATHRATHRGAVEDFDGAEAAATVFEYSKVPQIDNRVRLHYVTNKTRMQRRIRVVARAAGLLNDWRDGCFDCAYIAEEQDGAELEHRTARCARIILRLTRSGESELVEDEICAYVPYAWEYKEQKVYRTAAAERLRLWLLKGLMMAEIHGRHVVLLEADVVLLLSQCIGLLWGDGGEDDEEEKMMRGDEQASSAGGAARDGNAGVQTRVMGGHFHVCKILMETVEDYVQHSGVVWQVIVAVNGEEQEKWVQLCNEILTLTQEAKCRVEQQERLRAAEEAERERIRGLFADHPASARVNKILANERPKEPATSRPNTRTAKSQGKGQLVVVPEPRDGAVGFPALLSTAVATRARVAGLHLTDDELYPLFVSLCDEGAELLPVARVVQLLRDKLLDEPVRQHLHWPLDHPLLALDGCGVPWNERRITNFVMNFCHRPHRSGAVAGANSKESEPSLNYVEFSMMMLALAHQ